MGKKTSTKQLEQISLLDVQRVLRDSLALDEDFSIEPSKKIADFSAEPIDFLDFFYRLKIPFQDYTHGERLTERGKMVLINIANEYIKKNELRRASHFLNLAKSYSTKDFINQFLVSDLIDLGNYKE